MTVDAVGLRRRRVGHALGDAHANARRRPREQVPQKRGPASRHGRGHVGGRVAQADGEYLHVGGAVEQAGAKGQDGLAVGRGALGEHGDRTVGVLLEEVLDGDELSVGNGRTAAGRRRREGHEDGGEEADALDLAGARVGDGEDGVEDGGEVDGVDGAREIGGDDGAAVGETVSRLVGEGAALDAVELQVYPPDARDGHETPQGDLAGDDGQGQVVEDEEVAKGKGDEEGDAEGEDEAMVDGAEGGEGRGDGEEWSNAGR